MVSWSCGVATRSYASFPCSFLILCGEEAGGKEEGGGERGGRRGGGERREEEGEGEEEGEEEEMLKGGYMYRCDAKGLVF